MEITSQEKDRAAILAISGRADISKCHKLHREVHRACKKKPAKVIIDLSGVDYADTSCVAVMVSAVRRLQHHDGKLILAGASTRVGDTFRISRLDDLWEVADSVESISGEER